jgi:16S rRNA (cytosine1402-N4)-methyltransferase
MPVFAQEVLHFLEPAPGKLVMDATLGGGGHAEGLLAAGASVLGLDRDPDAIAAAKARLARLGAGDRLAVIQANFRDFGGILAEAGVSGLDGVLADLGVSSHQLDTPARGFSFRTDGPLDMRMDPAVGATAADLVNGLGEPELADLIARFGEERAARRVARAIVAERRKGRIDTTSQLAAVVGRVVPRRGRADPATRVFQALRIAVNDELGALADLLEQSVDWLRPGGRLVVITFHSIEDRVVKDFIRSRSAAWTDSPGWPEPRPNPLRSLRPVLRKALTPSAQELASNPRARSAKLRVAERLEARPT